MWKKTELNVIYIILILIRCRNEQQTDVPSTPHQFDDLIGESIDECDSGTDIVAGCRQSRRKWEQQRLYPNIKRSRIMAISDRSCFPTKTFDWKRWFSFSIFESEKLDWITNFHECFGLLLCIADVSLCRNFDLNTKIIAKNQDRTFTAQQLKRTHANGEAVERDWVIYSPSENSIFCFSCLLFGKAEDADNLGSVGISNFHNNHRTLKRHEISSIHCSKVLSYKTWLKESSVIETCFINQTKLEIDFFFGTHHLGRQISRVQRFCISRF